MAVPYQNLRSNTAGNVPTLPLDGLLAINQADGKLYYRSSTGVVTQFGAALFAAIGHSHGNLTNAGAIGTTANQIVVTGASGVITVATLGSTLSLSGGTLTATGVTDGARGDITVAGSSWTITAGAVVTADLADSAVTTAKIANGAVTLAKTTGLQKTITSGTAAPSGGSDGDIYLQYA